MTQNTAWSLVAATVIAAGFLVGWCASALEPASERLGTITTSGAGRHSSAPAGERAGDAQLRPARAVGSDSAPLKTQ